jgi:phosphoglycolate phosphatase
MSRLVFDLVLFDLDGTLIETGPEIADAVNDLLKLAGFTAVGEQVIENWIGHGTRELLLQALRSQCEMDVASAQFKALEGQFAELYLKRCGTRSKLYPAVRETLEQLRQCQVSCVLMTNKESRYTLPVINAHGLDRLFDLVICGDTLPVKKPDPAGVQLAMQQFSASPTRTLFVGDSSIDIETARRAGIDVWAVPYGYNMGKSIEAFNPTRLIVDISALLQHTDAAQHPCSD